MRASARPPAPHVHRLPGRDLGAPRHRAAGLHDPAHARPPQPCEFAGVVEPVGQDVTSFEIGNRVFGYNEGPFGAHAEYLAASQASAALIPSNSTLEEAAAATEGAHDANVFIRRAKIKPGKSVLVSGATGAVGSAAVQLLKVRGAEVTAVCAGEHKALLEGMGADRVIDCTTDDFTHDHQTYDVIL